MDDESKKIIQEQFAKLPADVQRAIQSAHLHEQVESIGKKNQLHIDQVGLLEDEVILVMLGLENPDDFSENLVTNLRLKKEEAQKVAIDVGNDIMMPIRESMKKFMEEESPSIKSVISELTPAPPNPSTVATKSVVMPSSIAVAPKSTLPQAPIPSVLKPAVPTVPPAPAMPKPPMPAPDLHPAEVVLTEKTVQVPAPVPKPESDTKSEPPKPGTYKADPYREPIE